ncbi:MAG TPA: bifunctional phosphopantothenoylcysteine decarboxylase/phosphopantothenate--cysteine ligase CoaBC [Bacteroidia bacterium]|nr:bifunctional phosphopantothenoylcysteine decarboxylase/phosphopantothenate--cysteine ligase CoaBC [Bacteroidia bacterium]
MLNGKKIVLGVTAGIAAYKAANLVRLFVKKGAEVKVIMTPDAQTFVSPHTLSVLSKNKVEVDFFDAEKNWNNHVHLALWADAFVIAPCTANTLAKMATGLCDNLLLATYLSARCKVYVAPAMDVDMYHHPTAKNNIEKIVSYGNIIIPPETGELASGLHGEGRMAEPENIVAFIEKQFDVPGAFKGKKVLLSAGPTYEEIDPVRFIGNRSTGKMGIALANAFANQGAEVTLVLGPTHLLPNSNVKCIRVESANEMYEHCIELFKNSDIAIMSAAVADYKAADYSAQKIKKKEDTFQINLTKTVDILAELGKQKKQQCLVGFALETENVIEYATKKIKAKNLNFIVANSLQDKGAGFATDTNKVNIIDNHGKVFEYGLKSKEEVAKDILNFTLNYLKK